MVSDKLLLNILKNFDSGISLVDLVLHTFHSDYDFDFHPNIEVDEAVNELVNVGILKKHEHKIQGKIKGSSISINFEEILKRIKVLNYIIEYNTELPLDMYQFFVEQGLLEDGRAKMEK